MHIIFFVICKHFVLCKQLGDHFIAKFIAERKFIISFDFLQITINYMQTECFGHGSCL